MRRVVNDSTIVLLSSLYTNTYHTDTEQETIFSTAKAAGLTVAVTFILTMIIGLGSGMALMYCISSVKRTRKFTVSIDESSHPSTQAHTGPLYQLVLFMRRCLKKRRLN